MKLADDLLPRFRLMLVREAEASCTSYPRFANSRELFEAFREELAALDCEHFFAITVDSKNRTIGHHTVSVGSLSHSIVHPREVFKRALLDNASGILLMHNHVSGDPSPSKEDRECTERLLAASKIVGIRLLDHIIFGDDYFSFSDAGLLADNSTAA